MRAQAQGHAEEKNQAAEQHEHAKNRQGGRRTDVFGDAASDEGPYWLHTHEHGGVDGHDAAAQFIGNAALHDGVGGGHLHRRGEADEEQDRRGKPEHVGLRKNYQARAGS